MAIRGRFRLQHPSKALKIPAKKPDLIKDKELKVDPSTLKDWNDKLQRFMSSHLSDPSGTSRNIFEFIKFHFIEAHLIAAFVDNNAKPVVIKYKMRQLANAIMKLISIDERDKSKFKNYLIQVFYRSCMMINKVEGLLENVLKNHAKLDASQQAAIQRWDILEWCFLQDAKAICSKSGLKIDDHKRTAISNITKKYITPSKINDETTQKSFYLALVIFNLACLFFKVNFFDKNVFDLLGLILKFIAVMIVAKLFLGTSQTFKTNAAKLTLLKQLSGETIVNLEREFIQEETQKPSVERLTVDVTEKRPALILPNPKHTVKGMSSYSYLRHEHKYSSTEIHELKMAKPSLDAKDSSNDTKGAMKDEKIVTSPKPNSVSDEKYLIHDGKKPVYIQLMQSAKVPGNILPFFINSLEKGYIGSKRGPGICNSNEPGFFKKWRPNAKSGGRLYCPKETFNEDGSETWTFTRYFKNHKDKTVTNGVSQKVALVRR